MVRIAYWFSDEKYKQVVVEFCENEGMCAVDISAKEDGNISYAFFITDSKDILDKFISVMLPCCLVGEERCSHQYYTVGSNFTIFSLRMLLDHIHHGGSLWNMISSLSFDSFAREVTIGNNIYEVEKLACQLTWDLLYYFNFSVVEKIRVGLSEMVTNAIEHGNLAITNEQKHESTENGTYSELIEKRLQDQKYNNRKVHIKVEFQDSQVKISVRDEGSGFDINDKLFTGTGDDGGLLTLHGRGIFMAKAYFDVVEYNEVGNKVTLVKHL